MSLYLSCLNLSLFILIAGHFPSQYQISWFTFDTMKEQWETGWKTFVLEFPEHAAGVCISLVRVNSSMKQPAPVGSPLGGYEDKARVN